MADIVCVVVMFVVVCDVDCSTLRSVPPFPRGVLHSHAQGARQPPFLARARGRFSVNCKIIQ